MKLNENGGFLLGGQIEAVQRFKEKPANLQFPIHTVESVMPIWLVRLLIIMFNKSGLHFRGNTSAFNAAASSYIRMAPDLQNFEAPV